MAHQFDQALSRPRHLMISLGVFLAFGGLGGLVVGAANAADGEEQLDSEIWDEPFHVPMPSVGDHGRYVRAGGTDTRDDGYWPADVEFAWLEDGEAFNETGARVAVNRLLYAQSDRLERTFSLLPGTTRQISHESERNDTEVGPGRLPLVDSQEASSDRIRHVQFYDRDWNWACGIRNPLQGFDVDLRSPLRDSTTCWNGPGSTCCDEYLVVARWVVDHDAGRVAVVDSHVAKDGEIGPGSRPFLRSYFLEGVPYPVRLEYRPEQDGTSRAAYFLEGLTRADQPIGQAQRVLAPAPPAVALAPRTETGPDEAGVDHPFPLSRAWAEAKVNPTFRGGLASYLDAHPGAYVAKAVYEESSEEGQIVRYWYIVASDGQEQYAFRAEESAVSAEGNEVAVVTTYTRLQNWEDSGLYPRVEDLPTHLPTVASMMTAWEALVPGDQVANAWGFSFYCGKDSCDPDNGYAYAGIAADRTSGIRGIDSERFSFESTFGFWGDGEMSVYSERQMTSSYSLDSLPAPDEDVEQDAARAAPAEALDPGWLPSATQAAVIGAAAFLAALAYWLSPLAKTGGLAMFSRIHKSKVLDNPLRRELVERIEADPGIHLGALVRDVGRGKGAIEHHLARLTQARLVLCYRGTGYTCFFPVGTDRRVMSATPATKSDGAQRILQAVQGGACGVREVAAATGLAPSTVSHHLHRLRGAGLVVGDGRSGYHAVAKSGVSSPATA